MASSLILSPSSSSCRISFLAYIFHLGLNIPQNCFYFSYRADKKILSTSLDIIKFSLDTKGFSNLKVSKLKNKMRNARMKTSRLMLKDASELNWVEEHRSVKKCQMALKVFKFYFHKKRKIVSSRSLYLLRAVFQSLWTNLVWRSSANLLLLSQKPWIRRYSENFPPGSTLSPFLLRSVMK